MPFGRIYNPLHILPNSHLILNSTTNITLVYFFHIWNSKAMDLFRDAFWSMCTAIVALKLFGGAAPEVNLGECVCIRHIKTAGFNFETIDHY